ncbi:hypothetical protein A2598_04450 [Candidatus Peribacteria bacterium RIFOXYD1_FULL_54_13]|nr:MAG: hypothetical protein A2598_04450 [Candidatus Peribacteria bacterium RIFOXYD1_FULL_54_13]
MNIRPYQQLIAWKEAHTLCLRIYSITRHFPSHELFQLVSQMRRSAYGVPMNIAEGNSKRSAKEKAHFFACAIAPLEELHYQCVLGKDLRYLSDREFSEVDDLIMRVSYLITKLRSSIL